MPSRRNFAKFVGQLGLGFLAQRLLFGKKNIALAEATNSFTSSVQGPSSPLTTKTVINASEKPLIWVDGLNFSQIAEVRTNIAILLREKQEPDSYVISAYLTQNTGSGSNKVITSLAFRVFGPEDKLQDGSPPYLIFNDIDISANQQSSSVTYGITYAIRSSKQDDIYTATFQPSDLYRSRLNNALFIGADMRNDSARVSAEDGGSGGIINGIFERAQAIGNDAVATHQLDAKLIQLNGDSFTIRASILHTAKTPSKWHYSKYFLVTDPVGRLLGYAQRNFEASDQCQLINPTGCVDITALTENQRNELNILSKNTGKISDCPYVMVFVDDLFSVAKTIIYL